MRGTKLVSSISEFKKFRKQTNPISIQKTTGHHFASSRVGGHRIISSENHWEAFPNTKHYSTSDSSFVTFSFLYHYSTIWDTSFLVSVDSKPFFFPSVFFLFFCFCFYRQTVAGATEKVASDIAGRKGFLTTLYLASPSTGLSVIILDCAWLLLYIP